MKKILSLVLAAAMLSTTAMAASVNITLGVSTVSNPGNTLYIMPNAFVNEKDAANTLVNGWRFSTEYFSVATKKFSKGANLVKEVKINDGDNRLDIVLNDNYDLARPKAGTAAGANLVIDEISVKAKKDYNDETNDTTDTDGKKVKKYLTGDIKKSAVYEYAYTGTTNELKIGYDQETNGVDAYEQKLNSSPRYVNGTMVKFVKENDVVYETVSLSEGDVFMEGRVYDGDKVFIEVDYEVNKDVLKANEDASIRFLNITTNGLPTANVLQITAEEDEFVYKLVDGKIVDSGLKWSSDDYAWVGKIRTTTSYVISDIKLNASSAPSADGDKPATGNPDTGANDVVGIAAALAVVSLVAAGAVSLKK